MTEESTRMDAATAARLAVGYLDLMLPQAEEILLEEVEKVDEGEQPYWLITLSYSLNLAGVPTKGLRGMGYSMGRRDYKSFKIDALTGEVVSMKIRAV